LTQAYPLRWPEGWPRTPSSNRDWNSRLRRATFDAARRSLYDELQRLDARSVVLSTNIPLRLDGQPYATMRPDGGDPGCAVYFSLRGKQMVMARDSYTNIEQNMRSLALAVEHLRGLERHGGAYMMERAFAGFAQLPPPDGQTQEQTVDWREELGPFPADLPPEDQLLLAEGRYRARAKNAHSDAGGSDAPMIRLNLAIAQARRELNGHS
jgi:hypothetical protein